MGQFLDLVDELTVDPEGRGYSGMTNEQIAESLATKDRTRNRTSLTGSEVLNAIDTGEFNALSADQKQTVWNVVHLGDINPFGVEQVLFVSVFGSGSTTIAALATIRVESISRLVELELGKITLSDIAKARV